MPRKFIGVIVFGISIEAGCVGILTIDGDDVSYCVDPVEGVRAIRHPQPGEIEFSEIMADSGTTLDASGEWVELRVSDTVKESVDLNGLVLTRGRGTNAAPSFPLWLADEVPECMEVGADEYIVLTDDDLGFGLLNGASDRNLYLSLEGADEPIAEFEAYEVSPGAAWSHDLVNDQWCFSSAAMDNDGPPGVSDQGTPGESNPECGKCWESDEQRAIVPPDPTRLLITEFLANSPGSNPEYEEWFEIHVLPGEPFDLNGLRIETKNDSETLVHRECIEVTGGEHLVFTDALQIEGLTPAYVLNSSFNLVNNEGDTISLSHAGASQDHIVWWEKRQDEGISTSLDTDNYDMPTQAADEPPWCSTADPSPGQRNGQCP